MTAFRVKRIHLGGGQAALIIGRVCGILRGYKDGIATTPLFGVVTYGFVTFTDNQLYMVKPQDGAQLENCRHRIPWLWHFLVATKPLWNHVALTDHRCVWEIDVPVHPRIGYLFEGRATLSAPRGLTIVRRGLAFLPNFRLLEEGHTDEVIIPIAHPEWKSKQGE